MNERPNEVKYKPYILGWYSTYFWIHQGKQILAETLRKSMANGNAQYKWNKSSFLYLDTKFSK